MAYSIVWEDDAKHEFGDVKPSTQRKIAAEIDKQLPHQADVPSKNRKPLEAAAAGFDFDPPLWELRVGEWRVFYDIDQEEMLVHIRTIRRKPPEKRTEDILE